MGAAVIDENLPAVEVIFSNDVVAFLMENIESPRVLSRIEQQKSMLELFPEMGRTYQPEYEAAYPSVPCRWIAVPDTPFTLYYHFDEKAQTVVIFHIEHQRMNPAERFS